EMMAAHHGTGAATQQSTATTIDAQGFSSTEEMMAAHHGTGAATQQSTASSMQSHHGSGEMVGGC
ncbi:MAG: hypothetical protein AABX14_01770, partial [Candidatus Aenigmatarchaeota archaeon]